MKNLIKFSIVMVVLCITACTQTFENTSNEVQKKAQGRLVMNMGNESRTIKPTIGESDVKTAVLTANGNEIKSWSDDNIIRQIENTEDILLDVGNYDFTMTFRNADNIDILTASTSLEIVAGDNILDFKMKPVTTGTGDISITLTWDVVSGIDKITAGLYDIATNDFLEGFGDRELDITTSNEQKSTTLYSLSGVPVGQYIIKFKIYEGETYEKHLNTLSEVIHVAAGITTSSQITLSKINTQYSITYNPNGGTWTGNFIVTDERNANKKITLPTANDITREGYEFAGWYDNDNNKITEIPSDTAKNISVTAKWLQLYTITYNLNGGNNADNPTSYTVETETITLGTPTKNSSTFLGWYNESGDKITEIKPSETAANITVTARWSTTCTVSEAKNVITSLSGDGPHDIVVQGGITDSEIGGIKYAIRDSKAKVNLDLSGTTGLISLGNEAFSYCSKLISIIIPDSVETIAENAFSQCNNLTEVSLPGSMEELEDSTFSGCSNLKRLKIPDSVTSIVSKSAFKDCVNLTEFIVDENNPNFSTLENGKILCDKNKETLIAYPSASGDVRIPEEIKTIGDNVFYECSSLTSIEILSSVTSIGKTAFYKCTNLINMIIPDSVTTIGEQAFRECSSLKSVTIGRDVKSLDDNAFRGCSALTSVTFAGDSELTTIGDNAFQNCSNLTSIIVPDGVTSIGGNAFVDCSKLTSITIPNKVISIGNGAFARTALTSVSLPESIIEMGINIFSGCSNLITVELPKNIISIPQSTFQNCSNLTSIIIPDGVTSIGGNAFSGCLSLASIDIPSGVTSIGSGAFQGTGLTHVTFADNSQLTTIGPYVFNGCSSLESVTIPSSVTLIDANVFDDCINLTSITIPTGVTSIGGYAFNDCTKLTSVIFESNSQLATIGGYAFSGCSSLTSIEIPVSVTSIDRGAFYGCSGLTNINIPNNVTSIDSNTFGNCMNLASIIIPASVKSIGNYAFDNCTNLTRVTFASNSQLATIGGNAFSGCPSLTSIEIPDNVTSIGSSAFQNCTGLTSVIIPDSVTSIGGSAFSGCSSLTTVNYKGTQEEWNQKIISGIGSGNEALTNATINYGYTGE